MKIIVAPDKFKGSLTSMEVCMAVKAGIKSCRTDAEVLLFPMADGGDGFAAVIKHYSDSETIVCETRDPLMRNITATYEWINTGKTAVIELASASGLMLLDKKEQNPLYTSTFGTGLMIQHALDRGAKKIILGLGGSATNDAGTGILSALGFSFRDGTDHELTPVGENLDCIKSIVIPTELPEVEFIIACDVSNKLFGKEGAAFVYAPQKGADETAVQLLDKGLRHFAQIIAALNGKGIADFSGSGAAGGVAAGLSAFFKTSITSGAALIVHMSKLENHLQGADAIITGEGRLDDQSSSGKVVQQVTQAAAQFHIPVIALCGGVCLDPGTVKKMGLYAAYSLIDKETSLEAAMKNAAALLAEAAALICKNQPV